MSLTLSDFSKMEFSGYYRIIFLLGIISAIVLSSGKRVYPHVWISDLSQIILVVVVVVCVCVGGGGGRNDFDGQSSEIIRDH